jgi:hypothetical protein
MITTHRERVSGMQRPRRLVSVVAVALTGACLLSACRVDPEVAAYVGDHRITEAEVTRLVAEATPPAGEQTRAAAPSRSAVVGSLVLEDVCRKLSADKGYQPKRVYDAAQVAAAIGAPPESGYARSTANLLSCQTGLPVQQVTPTEADLADVIARGRAAGALPAEMTDQQAAQQLAGDTLAEALSQRKVFSDALSGYDVTVNPRYRPLEYPILPFRGGTAAVVVPIGEADSGTVVKAS